MDETQDWIPRMAAEWAEWEEVSQSEELRDLLAVAAETSRLADWTAFLDRLLELYPYLNDPEGIFE